MSDDPTTGIPYPDKPGHWLVPPWATNASFSDLVRHFLSRHPWGNTNTVHLLAYFEGYEAALDAAPTDELTYAGHQRWYDDMRDCVSRCATIYREMHAAEIQRAKGTVSTLPTAVRETHRVPAHPKAS